MYQKYSRLITQDYKLTSARKTILDVLILNTTHQTADEIYQNLRMVSKKLGIATVYRTLELFEKLNIVEVLMNDQTKYYKIVHPSQKNHIHFICKVCEQIIEYDDSEMLEFNKKLNEYLYEHYHHEITEHISLTGICETCLTKKETEV